MTPSAPPRLLRLLAVVLLPSRDHEFVLGDMDELYARRVARQGRGAAGRRYLADLLASVAAGLRRGRRHRRARGPLGTGRRRGGGGWGIPSDLRSAVRGLRREPGFAALTVLTLALGVGSTAAVFGMVNQLLLRPLPGVGNVDAAYLQFRSIEEPERTQGRGIATLDFDELRRSATLLAGAASFGNVSLTVGVGDARPVRVMGNTVYGDFFEVVGAWPAAGRLLRASETALGSDPLQAVISRRLGVTLFGSDGAAVGETVRVNGHPVTVVGVAGGGFAGAERGLERDMWLPYGALVPLVGFTEERLRSRESTMHGDIIVRPRAGAGTEAVTAQVAEILDGLAGAGNESGPYLAELEPRLFPGLHTPPLVRAATDRSLRILAGVVALLLLIACANAANLLLFRNVQRRGAVATRRALGASTARIAGEHLAQSLVLGLAGTGVGLGVGWLIALPFKGTSLMRMPAFDGLILDGRVLLFAGAACVATTLLFGTVPAALAGRFDLAGALRGAGGRDTGRAAHLRSGLSAAQLALSLALVVGALLLLRTLQNLRAVDMGVSVEGVWAVSLEEDRALEPAVAEQERRRVLAAVRAMPDVDGAVLDPYGPFGATWMGRIRLPDTPARERTAATMVPVTPGWLELFRVPVLSGRTFRDEDWGQGAPPAVILTASLARRLFGGTEVVGRRVMAGFGEGQDMEIVGVVGDVRTPWDPERPEDTFFLTFTHAPAGISFYTLLARTSGDDAGVARRLRATLEGVLPGVPVPDPAPLADRVSDIHSERRVYGRLLTLLSALAVVLSTVGLYGVVAFTVAARRREFGVRLALGAARGRVAGLVARSALTIVGTGTLLGLGGAYALSRVLRSRLFGVEPVDPASYAGAALAFAVVALVACWIPARRAMSVDPAATLREE